MEAALKLEPEHFEVETKVLTVPDKAKAIEVKDEGSYKQAGELLLVIKDLRKEIDDTFNPIIKKAHESHKEALAQKKKVDAPLVEAERIIKPRMVAYHNEQERKRREEEERLREEVRKQEEEKRLALAIEAEKQGMAEVAQEIIEEEPAYVPPPVIPTATPKVTGIAMKATWKFRITSPNLVPNQYKIIDEKAIGKVVRALGERTNIPGVEVYQEKNLAAGRR